MIVVVRFACPTSASIPHNCTVSTGEEMVGWHHRLNGHEFEQTLGDSEGQGSLACCSPRGRKNGHNWATEQQQQSSFLSLVTMCCILFFLIFIYFNWRLITLQYCIGLPYINMNQPQVYTCSPSWTPFLFPPCTIPLGHLSAPAPSIRYHTSNLDWQFISYMILYMFQCHSPKSPHPLGSPTESKRLFYTSVSLAVSHTRLSLPSF